MDRRRLSVIAATALAAGTLMAGPAAAANGSCTAQFTTALAPVWVPFGLTIVVPEVRTLDLGGPNLGQEVKVLFATADRTACPVTP